MTDLPDPPVPAEADLRDFAFMPLDVVRLRDSAIAVTARGDEFRAAVLLWCTAWHQVPAGSLPDDEALLAQYAGYGRVLKEWRKVREGALRGFVKCSDGRLYHPVVCEKVLESWSKKVEHDQEKAADRERKRAYREQRRLEDERRTSAAASGGRKRPSGGNPAENALKGQGEGQGHKEDDDHPQDSEAARDLKRRKEVGDRICGIMGIDPKDPTWFGNYSVVSSWLASGCDPGLDIYPAIEATLQRKRQRVPSFVPRGLEYFTEAVLSAKEQRSAAPAGSSAARANGRAEFTDQDIENAQIAYLDVYLKTGKWLGDGAAPGKPGCLVEKRLIRPEHLAKTHELATQH